MGIFQIRELGEKLPDPFAVITVSANDEVCLLSCLAAYPRQLPFLLPSPADRSGGAVAISRFGVFSGDGYFHELGTQGRKPDC